MAINTIMLVPVIVTILSFILALHNFIEDDNIMNTITLCFTFWAIIYCVRSYVLVIAR